MKSALILGLLAAMFVYLVIEVAKPCAPGQIKVRGMWGLECVAK